MPRIPIIMPQLGESIAEATIVRIPFALGDTVDSDQDIIEEAIASKELQLDRFRQRQRDAPGKLGDSPSTSHDKRRATYCRKLDIASAPASKKYAIVAVVRVNRVPTVCATEQFRTWTLTRPQSTTVTIETAIWSLLSMPNVTPPTPVNTVHS
jgi:hypothetical protein